MELVEEGGLNGPFPAVIALIQSNRQVCAIKLSHWLQINNAHKIQQTNKQANKHGLKALKLTHFVGMPQLITISLPFTAFCSPSQLPFSNELSVRILLKVSDDFPFWQLGGT